MTDTSTAARRDIRGVELVCTPERAARDFPHRPPVEGARLAARIYAVDPARCRTMLGRFLAEHIPTTRRDDDASELRLGTPWTLGDRLLRDMAAGHGLASPGQGRKLAARVAGLRAALDHIERQRRFLGDDQFDDLEVERFDWPVHGSARAQGADGPEAYFDACAKAIRSRGAVVLSAGLGRARPAESLTATMAGGQGLHLLRRHLAQQASFAARADARLAAARARRAAAEADRAA